MIFIEELQIPYGGMKSSGFGRLGGRVVIDEFTVLRIDRKAK